VKDAERAFQKPLEAEYARKLPSDRLALARRLLELEAPADPARNYVRLRDARDFAAQGGDAETALAAAERISESFAADAILLKSDALAAVANVRTTDAALAHARACLRVLEEAVAADRYDVSPKLAARTEAAAKTAKDDDLLASVRARSKEVASFAAEFQQLRAYAETIERRPDDVASNLNLGKFRAFTKDDWDRGLPLLARGSDPVLRSLAEKELARPEDAPTLADLCEGWLAQAEKERSNPLRREHLLARARSWYGRVEDRLTESDRARLSKRLGPAPAASVVPPKSAPATLRPGSAPGTFDLMALVDPARDTVHGAWSRAGAGLLSPAGGDNINTGSARIWIPYAPPEEYEIFIEIERKAGNEDFVIGLVSPSGKPFAVGLDGWGAQGGCGVFANGQWNRVNASRVIGPSGKHAIGIHVRKDRFRLRVQNQDVITVPDYGPLGMPAHVQVAGRAGGLVIGAVRSSFQVHSLMVKPLVGGPGRILPR
jgi:hypothetical protein